MLLYRNQVGTAISASDEKAGVTGVAMEWGPRWATTIIDGPDLYLTSTDEAF